MESKILQGKPQGRKQTLDRLSHKWEGNLKIVIKERG
jgi:hypothetical protein